RQEVILLACHHAFAAVGHARALRGPNLGRSSRLSLAPLISLRRRRASADVIGAGATGPRRFASRLGVGRPFGAVVFDVDGDDSPVSSRCASASTTVSSVSFFRPSKLTAQAYFGALSWLTVRSSCAY